MLTRARGAINFSESGFSLVGIQARAVGGDFRLDGGTHSVAAGSNEPSLTLRAQGTASAEGLRQARELGFLSRLAREANGSASYNAAMSLPSGDQRHCRSYHLCNAASTATELHCQHTIGLMNVCS